MRAVNLLPGQISTGRPGLDRALLVAIGLTVLVTALVAGGFFLERSHAASEAKRAAAIQAELTRLQSQNPTSTTPASTHLEVPVVLSQEQPWHLALDSALSGRVAWDTFLQQLEYVVPDNVRITDVSVGGPGTAAGMTNGTITLGGTAFSSDDVAVFLSTLARVPGISQVALTSITGDSTTKIKTFQATAQMTLPAAATTPPATATTTTTGG